MNNHSNMSPYCAVAEAVLGERGFSYLLALEIIVGSLAVLANAPLVILVWRISVFHYNLRLLLSHLSFLLLWYSVGYIMKATYLLRALVTVVDPCSLVMTAYDCMQREYLYIAPVSLTMYSLFFLNLERLYSTIRCANYDQGGPIPWLAILFIAAPWAVHITLCAMGMATVPRDRLIGVCEYLLSMNPIGAKRAFWLSASLLTGGVVCCAIGYLWNNYKLRHSAINRAQHTLASRFQIDQNVKVNRIIMPSMLIVTICYLPNYCFLLVVIAGMNLSYEKRTWFIHINYLWKVIYALAHALILFQRNTYLRERVEKARPDWMKTSKVECAPVCEQNVHFSVLEQVWNTTRRQKKASDDTKLCSSTILSNVKSVKNYNRTNAAATTSV